MMKAIFVLFALMLASCTPLVSAFIARPAVSLVGRSSFSKATPLAAAVTLLDGFERSNLLPDIYNNGWELVKGRDAIKKHFEFADFQLAFKFMTDVAEHAERLQHHPEWFNVYNKIDVTLSTHDCNGLSKLDIEMARVMDQVSKNYGL